MKIIACDIGTTNIKSSLIDTMSAEMIIKSSTTKINKNGRYSHTVIWNTVKEQIVSLASQSEEKIISIAITGMAEAGIVVDKTSGKELSDIMPWYDRSTLYFSGKVSEETDREIFRKTGLRNSFKYGIYKYLYLTDEYTEEEKKNTVWLSMCDYIAYKLCRVFATDPTYAARTYVYDIVNRKWDTERIKEYGFDVDNFPKVHESGEVLGYCDFIKDYSIPVCISGHDHICASYLIKMISDSDDSIVDSAGTSEVYIGHIDSCPENGFDSDKGVLYGPDIMSGWFFMANVPSSGHSVEWYRKTLQKTEIGYDDMNTHLSSMPRRPSGITYLPYLTGSGSPWYNADARAMIYGADEKSDAYTILKAVTEGIQYQAKYIFDHIGIEKNCDIICVGGSSRNRVMMEEKADITGHKVVIPEISEATLAGSAAVSIAKMYGIKTAEEFAKNIIKKCDFIEPDNDASELYEIEYKNRFTPLCEIVNRR